MQQTAYKTAFQQLSELKAYEGKELGVSDWITITQERINVFADATEDHQWIHIDEAMAKTHSPYKTTIAHGFLVLSLASKFAYDTYSIADVGMGINYGLDRVRFPNATPVNARLRGRVSLIDFKEIEGGAQYKLNIIFEIEGQEKPACAAEFIARAYVKN